MGTGTETFFDPACGSGGFLVGAIEHVFRQIEIERDDENEILENKKDYPTDYVYGIDYDPVISKVAKAYMLILGDGRSNIITCDALNEDNWSNEALSKFTDGGGNRSKLRKFNIIATNPPFAGDIDIDATLTKYELAYKPQKNNQRKRVNKLSRDKLFIERCLNMLAPSGRLAIVVPRGVLKNYSDEYVRRYILRHAKIKAVVSLSGDMFKPFTNIKTCVLFLQKRSKPLENGEDIDKEPPIVFSVTEKPGKDKSGNIIFDENREIITDLPDIAEFIRFNIIWD